MAAAEQSDSSSSAASSSNASHEVTTADESAYVYQAMPTGNFCAGSHEKILLAGLAERPWDNVAIRIRHGSAGFTEWMTELQVYLLPNFKHRNVLEFYGSDECHNNEGSKFSKLGRYVRRLCKDDPRSLESIEVAALPKPGPVSYAPPEEPPEEPPEGAPEKEGEEKTAKRVIGPFRIEYWLMTRFADSMTLRDYLIGNTLTWPQLVKVAKGIMKGLYFLHENNEYQDLEYDEAVDSFINSTRGALRRVAFKGVCQVVHMKPHLSLTVVHRNLCSKNIVLKRDFTACIWNFGNAYIHHPFQPTNHVQLIDPDTKRAHLLSHYSPPEVLGEKGHLSLASMKSIDMYAAGIIMWELISRCVLPRLEGASEQEQREREVPDAYHEPLERELAHHRNDHRFIDAVVCRKRVRPRLKLGWLVGRKSYRYVQTMRDLWDPDFDARLHPATVIDRLKQLSLSDRDRRNWNFPHLEEPFDGRTATWPDKKAELLFQAPLAANCGPNKVFDDYSELPQHSRPHWISSDSEREDEATREGDGKRLPDRHSRPMMYNYELQRARRLRSQARARRRQVRFQLAAGLASSTPRESCSDLPHFITTAVENSFEMISLTTSEKE